MPNHTPTASTSAKRPREVTMTRRPPFNDEGRAGGESYRGRRHGGHPGTHKRPRRRPWRCRRFSASRPGARGEESEWKVQRGLERGLSEVSEFSLRVTPRRRREPRPPEIIKNDPRKSARGARIRASSSVRKEEHPLQRRSLERRLAAPRFGSPRFRDAWLDALLISPRMETRRWPTAWSPSPMQGMRIVGEPGWSMRRTGTDRARQRRGRRGNGPAGRLLVAHRTPTASSSPSGN
jgi:hypothetical protein